MWAQRMCDEMKLHTENMMLTLTYEKTDGNLHKDDVQKFLKRLRKAIHPTKIRYFCCGEYGGKFNRPHYHLIVFGFFPKDAKYITTRKGVDYYGSKFLESVWKGEKDKNGNYKAWQNGRQGGFISITKPTLEACRYCAKYLQKLDERPHITKPFTIMSRKPGIGANAVSADMLLDGLTYINGKSYPIPKFYIDKLENMGYNVNVVKARREYLYEHSPNNFKNASAVDSARMRGEIQERSLKNMR